MTDFNFIYHRRQHHVGVINGALWGAHDRGFAHSVVGNTNSNNRSITDVRSAA